MRVVCETLKRRAGNRSWSFRVRVVFPAPLGEERMRSRKGSTITPGSISGHAWENTTARLLLDVLDLLAHALDLGLQLDDRVRDHGVLALGADRVGLAGHLLEEEIEAPAHGVRAREERLEVRRVALETGQLLADVDAVGEERDLLLEAARVDVDVRRRRGAAPRAP